MRVAVLLCTFFISATALAQGKGGPSLDPLGDTRHSEPPEKVSPEAPRRVVTKVRVKKRTVRVTKTAAPAPRPVAPRPAKAKPKVPAPTP